MGETREGSEVYMPVPNEAMAMAAMIEALRAQTKAMEKQTDKLDRLSSSVAQVREDIAVMKVHDENMNGVVAQLSDVAARLTAIELRNAQQDGASKLVLWLKDVGPWLLGIIALGVLLLSDKLSIQ